MAKRAQRVLPAIGWREWVSLPDLGVGRVKAKVDTGARTSALQAFDMEPFEVEGQPWIRFEVHPMQRTSTPAVRAEAPILEYRSVRSSSGVAELRPVIETSLQLMDQTWRIELTLARRDEMGFRMLLGRHAFRDRFLVDAGRSFRGGRRL